MVNLMIRKPGTMRRRFADWPSLFDIDFSPFDMLLRDSNRLSEQMWSPRVDIVEKEDSWEFKAELPDVKPDEISVTIEDGILGIKGERKFEEEVKEGSFTRIERQYGCFERRFSLPSNVKEADIKADYKNGILSLVVPKAEEAKPKSIKIDVT